MSNERVVAATSSAAKVQYHTSGVVPLTRPQLVGTLTGLLFGALLAAIDQTIVGTAIIVGDAARMGIRARRVAARARDNHATIGR